VVERSAQADRWTGPGGLSALLAQLSADYPDICRRMICEALGPTHRISSNSSAPTPGELESAARDRLEAIRTNPAAATRPVHVSARTASTVVLGGDRGAGIGGPQGFLGTFDPIDDAPAAGPRRDHTVVPLVTA
jgi:hypothetical protein